MIDWSKIDPEENLRLTELHLAAQDGDITNVRRLLEEGCDPNLFDEISHTPLHYALEGSHLDVCETLLAAGADINAYEEERIGNTPIREVVEECSFKVAKWLIEHGADPTIEGWMRLTALHKAEQRNDPEGKRVYELLLSAAQEMGHTYRPLGNTQTKEGQ